MWHSHVQEHMFKSNLKVSLVLYCCFVAAYVVVEKTTTKLAMLRFSQCLKTQLDIIYFSKVLQ